MTRTPPLPLPLSKPPQGAADESERTESAAAMKQLTAIVVPSASPSNDTNTVTNEDQR